MAEIPETKRTPLYDLHVELGARMVAFAGYDMPVQFDGVKPEHLWTRAHAGLFDVSHMGPCFLKLTDTSLSGDDAHGAIAALIEQLVPSNIAGLEPGQGRLTVLLNAQGGILDDLIVSRPFAPEQQGCLYMVVNGAVKHQDWALFEAQFAGKAALTRADDRVLLALQGPEAVDVLAPHFPGCEDLKFMHHREMLLGGETCLIARCGYTGEDGFEILLPPAAGVDFAQILLRDERVRPVGLGARDTLRLEAGLCLYGNDMDASRNPVEAGLQWVIQKVRRERADFPGAAHILEVLADGPAEKRVGIQPLERVPARDGTVIKAGPNRVGMVTSGGYGPSVDRPIAMGYVRADLAVPGTKIDLMVRGKARAAEVCALPFVAHNYKR